MRSEKNLTEEFFRVFGIEPEINYVCDKRPCKKELLKTCADIRCSHLYDIRVDYPDFTAEKLLEMICLINKNTKYYNKSTYFKEDYKNLKDEILKNTLYCYKTNCLLNKEKEQFKHQIQQLFKD